MPATPAPTIRFDTIKTGDTVAHPWTAEAIAVVSVGTVPGPGAGPRTYEVTLADGSQVYGLAEDAIVTK